MTTIKPVKAEPRRLFSIAEDILTNWRNPYYGAVPYIKAMRMLNTINDSYGADSARDVVVYFLSNASAFRGEDARRSSACRSNFLRSSINVEICINLHGYHRSSWHSAW